MRDFKRLYNLDFSSLYIHENFLESFQKQKIIYLKQIQVISSDFKRFIKKIHITYITDITQLTCIQNPHNLHNPYSLQNSYNSFNLHNSNSLHNS